MSLLSSENYNYQIAIGKIKEEMITEVHRNGLELPRYGIFSILLNSVPIFVYDHPGMVKMCPTAFTDGYHIYISKDLIDRIYSEGPEKGTNGIIFLIMHELSHIMLRHASKERSYYDINPMLANIAQDYVINSRLNIDYGETLKLPNSLKNSGVVGFKEEDKKYAEMSFEQVLLELLKEWKKEEKLRNAMQMQCNSSSSGSSHQKQPNNPTDNNNQDDSSSSATNSSQDSSPSATNSSQNCQGNNSNKKKNSSSHQKQPNNSAGNNNQNDDSSSSATNSSQNCQGNNSNKKKNSKGSKGSKSGNQSNQDGSSLPNKENYKDIGEVINIEDLRKVLEEIGEKEVAEKLNLDTDEKVKEKEEAAKAQIANAASKATQINNMIKNMGIRMPGAHSDEYLIEQINASLRPKVTWRENLENTVREVVFGYGKKEEESPHEFGPERYAEIPIDNVLPLPIFARLPNDRNDYVLILIDTSGSMTNEDLNIAFSELVGLLSKDRDEVSNIAIMMGDTVLRGDPIIINNHELDHESFISDIQKRGIGAKGRGGTDMMTVINQSLQQAESLGLRLRSMVYITDLGDTPPQKEDLAQNLPKNFLYLSVVPVDKDTEEYVSGFAKSVESYARVYAIPRSEYELSNHPVVIDI